MRFLPSFLSFFLSLYRISETPYKVIKRLDRRVLRRILLRGAPGEALHLSLLVWVAEERNREATWHCVSRLARVLNDAVRGRDEDVVAPAHHAVSNVDDHRVRDGGDEDPLSVSAAGLKAAHLGLREERDGSVIRMGTRAFLSILVDLSALTGGVVKEPQVLVVLVAQRREEVVTKVHPFCERAQHVEVQCIGRGKVLEHRRLKSGTL